MGLHNRLFEKHSALAESVSFLRRHKKRRSQPFSNDSSGGVGHPSTVASTVAVASSVGGHHAGARALSQPDMSVTSTAARRNAADIYELRKPDPLDLATVVAPGLVKNQGVSAEKAFRAVGLTTVRGLGTKAARKGARGAALPAGGSSFSPPHLFWKAAVVAPSQTRGNVGSWLEAKLGGGGGAEAVAMYPRDVASQGVCPLPREGDVLGAKDEHEVACSSSARSKLIYRALRLVVKWLWSKSENQYDNVPARGSQL